VGREAAILFARRGGRVVLWDLSEEGLEETKRAVEAEGGEAVVEVVDISSRKLVYEAAAKANQLKWGTGEVCPVFALVNNAGIVSGAPLLDTPDERIIKTFEVNILAHFWTVKAFLPGFCARNNGHIVSVASVAGMIGSQRLVDYSASKFAAVGFAEALRNEIQSDPTVSGVHTSLICPAHIKTALFKGFKQPLVPSLEPVEVAEAIVASIENNTPMMVMPAIINAAVLSKAMLPTWLHDKLNNMVGVNNAMSGFSNAHADSKLQQMEQQALSAKL